MANIIPIIMSGGSGTRLWPISTNDAPKQFHKLATERTMIQETVLRLTDSSFLSPVIICGENHLKLVREQLSEIGQPPQKIVLEPMGRNTAPVAAIASLIAGEIDDDALVLLLPADHIVTNAAAFMEAINKAKEIAHQRIVTFGLRPTGPETGYGYIERGNEIGDGIYEIGAFREKPDAITAQKYCDGGKHDWNAGVFLFNPKIMLAEMAALAPDVLNCAKSALENSKKSEETVALCATEFAKSPNISIDYAIMEKTTKSAVVPCDIGWADVGSFAEIWRLGEKDENGNHIRANAFIKDANNCLVMGDILPISIIGIDDLIVIATNDGILIAPKNRAQDAKLACEAAKKSNDVAAT
ncbi:MAG: mannose-1-phosphate guanylyltransferase [Hyphomonadaceae bacterium]|nr:MAG: mannose-1-phosphate guanylyltransferase [Hyphomonadaceae bacterium]